MQRFHGVVQDPLGNAKNDAYIYAYDRGTLNLSSIYSDRAGLVAESNPLQSDILGMYDFCAADGIYDIHAVHPEIVSQWLREVHLKDIGYRRRSKSFTIITPQVGNDIDTFFAEFPLAIDKVIVRVQGGTSVEWNLQHNTTYGSGSDVLAADEVTAASATPTEIDSGFGDPTVPKGSLVWANLVAITGVVDWIHLTFYFAEDLEM